jgi:predicted glycosyltransferase
VRAVLFSNEMLGLGHVRRSLVLASAFASSHEHGTALVVTGSHAVGAMEIPTGVDVLKLPTAHVDPACPWRGSTLRPPATLAIAPRAIHELRAELSLAAVRALRPDTVVVDFSPLGREDDLRPTLEWLRAEGECTTALGLWEVNDDHDQRRWIPELVADVRRLYDLVLIYGQPSSDDARVEQLRAAGIPVAATPVIGQAPAQEGPGDLGAGYLLVTAGGGVDGYPLLDTALAAIRHQPLPIPTVLVAGPMMALSQVAALTDKAADLDVHVHRVRTDMDAVIAGARAVVSMAGYCTVAEVLASGKPALLVPRAFPRDEQLRRARRWAATGRLDLLEPDELAPATLRAALERLLQRQARPPEPSNGADFTVGLLAEAAERRAWALRAPEEPAVAQ